MKTATHSYKLSLRKDKDGKAIINLKFSYGFKVYNPTTLKYDYTPLEITTLKKIHPKYWDKAKNCPSKEHNQKFGNDIKNALNEIETTAYSQLNYFREQNNTDPTPSELKKAIDIKLGRITEAPTDKRITTFLTNKIAERQAIPIGEKKHWQKDTAKQYDVTLKKIKDFETATNKVLTFDNLTLLDCQNYLSFVASSFEYSQASMNKESRQLISILNMMLDADINLTFNFHKKLKIQTANKNHKTYLDLKMLTDIINKDVSKSKMLQHARNYIIISSLTSLRISDMIKLHNFKIDTIKNKNKINYLLTTTIKKSGAKEKHKEDLITTIPIPIEVYKLYQQNNNSFPKFPSEPNIRKYVKLLLEYCFPTITAIKTINKYGKAINKETLLFKDLFTPHDCRATFLTNMKTLGATKDVLIPITHPTHIVADVFDGYDKADGNDKALRIINNIKQQYPYIY
jgi:hypothetical protein